ncbi:three-helix bundle dimerization domain-containing protein [Cellulomonas fimi]|uniref:Uncharacterized protein n=1 Tax=Cellulomonas fimi TaxID=1708 RepID=A0A7Y0QIA4_CELFI|nr:hypothetical protein [Cellulomonas fimi]NMR20699.1 hypothetical protein [Cellulomonas fimi]
MGINSEHGPAVEFQTEAFEERLHEEFDPQLGPVAVHEAMLRAHDEFENARIDTFVPLLTYRTARDRLRAQLRTRVVPAT